MSKRRKPQSRNPAASSARGSGATRMGSSGEGDHDGESAQGSAGVATKGAAVGLWVVVAGGLVYGVSQTLVKVVALFS